MNKVQINPVLHFQNRNNSFILNSINNQIFKVSPELELWLKGNDAEPLSDSSTMESLKKSFVISDDLNKGLNDIYDTLNQKNIFMPSSVCLLISQDCNLRCSYCYGDGGRYNNRGYMSYEIATKAIDIIIGNAHALSKKPSINFFGGEPLLNFDLIKQVVAYVKGKGYDVAYSMTTNGTLITKEIEQFIIDNKINTQISIDGDEHYQNMNRYYANQKGSYRDVIKATANLREQGLLGARATITNDAPNFDTQILHLISLGFQKVNWGCAVETLTAESVEVTLKAYQNLCNEFYNLVTQENYKKAKKFGNIMRYLQRLHSVSIRDRTCGSGHSLMAVDIDGNIYPCHRFVGCDEYILGTVFQDITTHINGHKFYNGLGIRNHTKCLSCVARNFCSGGCMHVNYNLTSNVAECPDLVCYQTIEELKITAKLYTDLSKEQLSTLMASETTPA